LTPPPRAREHAVDMDKRGWLEGMDVRAWRDNIANGHTEFYILQALHETGVLAALREAGPAGRTVAELAASHHLNAHLLDGALHYLTFADEVLEKEGDRFRLSDRGREWLFSPLFLNMLYKLQAYETLHTEMLPALREEKRYGKDFVRRGDAVARFSEIGTRGMNPWVVKELGKLGARTVVDLGCGAAHTLISFCQSDAGLAGVGIDIDEGSLGEARRRIAAAGLGDRIRVAPGDLTRPDSYAAEVGDADAFHCMAALHEFLRDGEDAMVAMLARMKALFPGKHLLVLEFSWVPDDKFRALPLVDRIPLLYYQYIMHPHSWQGIPIPRESWLALFERAGLRVVDVGTPMWPWAGYVLGL